MNRYVKLARKPNNIIQINLIHPIDEKLRIDINRVVNEVVNEHKLKTIKYGRSYMLIECLDIHTMDLVYERVNDIASLYDNKFRYTLIDVASILIIGLIIFGIMFYNSGSNMNYLHLLEIIITMFCADILMLMAFELYETCKNGRFPDKVMRLRHKDSMRKKSDLK